MTIIPVESGYTPFLDIDDGLTQALHIETYASMHLYISFHNYMKAFNSVKEP